MNSPTKKLKIALTGPVQLELLAPYFREAGYVLVNPDEIPDVTYDVTMREKALAEETEGFYDPRLEKLAGCPYSLAGIRAIVDEFTWWLHRGARKVLAVDADNTLWRGILSEDGPAALQPYEDFQSFLKELRANGVLLVLLSKNDPGSIHLDWFTVQRVNWEPKSGNLIEACRALNVGTDSVVFVDDNPYERAQMKAHLPEVTVVPFEPPPTRTFMRRVKEYFFSDAGHTAEDRLRARDYARRFATRDAFLGDLGLWVKPARAAEGDLDRLAQMAGKTNQFNATTRRLTRAELAALLTRTWVFRAGDRFGEQGLVCYVIVSEDGQRLTDFVMSCRAMGRTLEHFVYGYMTRQLGIKPPVDFVPTPKNAPFAAFREQLKGEMQTYFKEV